MHIELRASELTLSARQRADIVTRVGHAFGRMSHRVTRVVVELRGGPPRRAKQCEIEVHVAGEAPVRVQQRHVNLLALVRRSLRHAWRAALARIAALMARRPRLSLPAPAARQGAH